MNSNAINFMSIHEIPLTICMKQRCMQIARFCLSINTGNIPWILTIYQHRIFCLFHCSICIQRTRLVFESIIEISVGIIN